MKDLLDYCLHLTRTMRWSPKGWHYWPNCRSNRDCGLCTSGARRVAKQFGGTVQGYLIYYYDPAELVGFDCYGHDFAVVDNYIVDWWGYVYEHTIPIPVLELERGIEMGYYKPRSEWKKV